MGQENSKPVDPSVSPLTLESRTVEGLAKYIKSGKCKKIVVMCGAGISTSAGIPDFRSPGTGLYANLARLNLPYAEAVFDIQYFKTNPYPFYMLAHELYPGKYRPTISHSFINLIHQKGLLLKLFTQNIDCLEQEAGLPGDAVIAAHGSFATQRCIECKVEFPDEEMMEKIKNKEVPHCSNKECNGIVKPDIVFFGEQLPPAFFNNRALPAEADLAIVMGTSLSVQPFASLPGFVSEGIPRVLINLEQVGAIGSRPDDVLILKKCDEGVRELAAACGYLEELEEMWAATGAKFGATADGDQPDEGRDRTSEEILEDEVANLTREVAQSLKITEAHKDAISAVLQSAQHRVSRNEELTKQREQVKEDMEKGAQNGEMPAAPLYGHKAKASLGGDKDLAHVFPHLKSKKPSTDT